MKKITAAFLLKMVCFLLIFGNVLGIAKALFNKTSLSTSYAAIPEPWHKYFIILPLFTIVSLLAVLKQRQWGFYVLTLITLVVLFMDYYAKFWEHFCAALISYMVFTGLHFFKNKFKA